MQLSTAPDKLLLPFANSGARSEIPVASQIPTTPGAASFTDGFPPLTRTPLAAGGVPPSGMDMNGILYDLSNLIKWANAGGGFPYDAAFATDSNVNGYPKGARVMRSDATGYWLNTVDSNEVNPESVTVNEAASAGWVPDMTNGIAAVTMTAANVTLTPDQYGKPIIKITGGLLADLNLIFPAIAEEWAVVNKCSGAFVVTCKTASGSGVPIPAGAVGLIYGDGTNIAALNRAIDDSAIANFNANATLTPFTANKTITTGVDAVTLTLPLTSSVPNGTSYAFISGQPTLTVACQGTDIFNNAGTSVRLGSLDTLTVVASNGVWWLISGSSQLQYSAAFGKLAGVSGYQHHPGGIIVQWGTWLSSATPGNPVAVTFPITFNNACFMVVPGANRADPATASAWYDTPTAVGFNGRSNVASIGCPYIAFGN